MLDELDDSTEELFFAHHDENRAPHRVHYLVQE